MKKSFALFAFFFLPLFALFAQDDEPETLFSGVNSISGFGGPMMQFSSVNGEFAFFMGGGGAVLFNRRFFLGGYGMGMTNGDIKHQASDLQKHTLQFGHGGFWLGYVIQPNKAVHFSVSSQAGWGGVSLGEDYSSINNRIYDEDDVFVLCPQAEVELNLTNFMRVGIGGGYRMVSGLQMEGVALENSDLSGPFGSLTFKFGWFQ